MLGGVVDVRWDQDKYDKEAREETEGNPLGCTGEGKSLKINMREGSREVKTETFLEWIWRWGEPNLE